MARRIAIPDLRFAALCFAGAALPWSKAGLSIGMGLLLLASLLHARPLGTFRSAVGAASLGMMLPLLISALTSEDLARGWKEWTSFWPVLFPFLGAAAVRDARRPRLFLAVLVVSTTAGTLPLLAHWWENFERYGELRRWFVPPTNIWLYTLSVCTGAFVSWSLLLKSRRAGARGAWGLVFALHLAAVLSTRRRMLILICCGILAWMTARGRGGRWTARRGVLAVGVLAALLATAFLAEPRIQAFLQPAKVLQQEPTRPLMWQFALEEFQRSPVIGTGLGDLRASLHEFADQEEARIAAENERLPAEEQVHVNLHHSHLHSNFMHTLAVAGGLGLLGVLIYLLTTARVLLRGLRSCDAAVLGCAAWALLFFGGISDASLFSSSRLSAFTILFAYAWGMLLRPQTETSDAAVD